MDYAEAIRNYIIDNFLFEDDPNLTEESSFLENGIVDSTGIIELVAFVEKTYGIVVADEELVPDNFDSIKCLSDYLHRKRNGHRVE